MAFSFCCRGPYSRGIRITRAGYAVTSQTLIHGLLVSTGSLSSVFGLWQRVRLSCHTSMTSWLPLDWVGAMVARLERKSAAAGAGKTAGAGAGEGAEGGEKES